MQKWRIVQLTEVSSRVVSGTDGAAVSKVMVRYYFESSSEPGAWYQMANDVTDVEGRAARWSIQLDPSRRYKIRFEIPDEHQKLSGNMIRDFVDFEFGITDNSNPVEFQLEIFEDGYKFSVVT